MNITQNVGYLTVRTSAAFLAIPIADAVIAVRTVAEDGSTSIFAILKTNESGETQTIEIPAPPQSNSLSPGGKTPYSLVNIEVNAEGYYSVAMQNVPIFPGITSTQNVNMIPLPDISKYDKYPSGNIIINESSVPNL